MVCITAVYFNLKSVCESMNVQALSYSKWLIQANCLEQRKHLRYNVGGPSMEVAGCWGSHGTASSSTSTWSWWEGAEPVNFIQPVPKSLFR